MGIFRGASLPPGKYWIDLHSPLVDGGIDTRPIFDKWSKEHKGSISVISTESTEEKNWMARALVTGILLGPFAYAAPIDDVNTPAFTFVTFEVHENTPWDNRMGYPNTIEPGEDVTGFDDVVSRADRSDYSVIADLFYDDPYQANSKTVEGVNSWKTVIKYGIIAVGLIPLAWVTTNISTIYKTYSEEKRFLKQQPVKESEKV